ncbi:hypothetical protein [Nannocystis bainbridge]|uniref:Uncharacterized protein n=1 Tax=Nannocystis bainbridge TaxID=2995303 RepID=A0ABT5DW49_9BACT|nr:hypothetical protein [Nannocystis bainbridge]MDC0717867.1 hypothetical protein [Nannocystis bainbridge]
MSLSVSVDEGHALEVLDMLIRGRPVRIVPTHPVSQPRAEVAEVAGRRIAVTCLRLLVESGRRERVVLRRGRRVRGRIWDAARSEGFRLRFTEATYELWVQATQRLAEIARPTEVVEGEGSSRRARRQIKRIIKIAGTDTGDWLVYALAVRHLARANMPREIREDLGRRLCLGSPLATLFALEDWSRQVDGEESAGKPALLLEGPQVVLLECLDDVLADQWAEQIGRCMRWSPGEERAERLLTAARVLEEFVHAIDFRARLDLARPLVVALGRLATGEWADPPAMVAARLVVDSGLALRSQQDALRRALARIVGLGERLAGLREAMTRHAFGDRRYEESQVYLELHDSLLRPHLGRLDALSRALTGRLG